MKKNSVIYRHLFQKTALTFALLGSCFSPVLLAQMSKNTAAISPLQINNPAKMAFAFQDVQVRALLQVLGETAGVNIVADESVSGTVSLNLKDVTWREALDALVSIKHLKVEQRNNAYFVSGDAYASNNNGYNSTMSGTYGSDAANNSTEVIQLQYQDASDLRKMMGEGQRMVSAQGSFAVDGATNQLIVSDAPAKLAQIREWVRKIDVPARQVLIEARIVEAEDSFSRSLGVKLGFNDASHSGFTSVVDPSDSTKTISVPVRSGVKFGSSLANVLSSTGQTASSTVNSMINFPALSSSSGTSAATFAMSIFSSGLSQFVNLEVSALETDGKGKIVSSPRVVTSNNVTAIIEQGTEIPYQQQANSSGATTVSFRKASLKLEVTPHIMKNGDVIMKVDVSKDSVGTLTSSGYTINTKHVNTQVKIENGATVVIGGIYQESKNNSVDKVPLLGDIPLLGNLFKTTNKTTNKTELLIFLTPYVLDDKGNPLPVSDKKFVQRQ